MNGDAHLPCGARRRAAIHREQHRLGRGVVRGPCERSHIRSSRSHGDSAARPELGGSARNAHGEAGSRWDDRHDARAHPEDDGVRRELYGGARGGRSRNGGQLGQREELTHLAVSRLSEAGHQVAGHDARQVRAADGDGVGRGVAAEQMHGVSVVLGADRQVTRLARHVCGRWQVTGACSSRV